MKQADAYTAERRFKTVAAGVMPNAENIMNKEKIKNTFEEFKNRDADRVTDMQQMVIQQGGDLGPDVVLMMMVDRLKDLSTLVAVMAKELTLEDDYHGQKH
jgi:hypothetical protein